MSEELPMFDDIGLNLDKYRHIAMTMNSFPIGETFSINALAERAGVHHRTARKALYFFLALRKIGLREIKWVRKKCPRCGR